SPAPGSRRYDARSRAQIRRRKNAAAGRLAERRRHRGPGQAPLCDAAFGHRGDQEDPRARLMAASFRSLIESARREGRVLTVPGVHDALSARLVERIGFESYFIGGFPVVGSRYAAPDLGLKGFGEISAAVRDIIGASSLPAFVDGDDGYGDVKNIVHTVHEYERMGVSALLFEDQAWPKRCGHMAGKKVVATE